ncbi:MAG: proline/glycine betaine ABC transporter permease [Bacillota bacterium]
MVHGSTLIASTSILRFLNEFPDEWQVPLADWIDTFADWLIAGGEPLFAVIADVSRSMLISVEQALLWLPWSLVILFLALVALKLAGVHLMVGVSVGLLFIVVLGLWDLAMSTLALVAVATLFAITVGIPMGIVMARSQPMHNVIRPILDMMQTLPTFVYLIPVLMIFSIGRVPALIATFVYAVPPMIRLTSLGIRQVPEDVVEAGESMGSTWWQILTNIQLPLALPSIMAGINQTVMMALSMVIIASMIGAEGLGIEVLRGIGRLEIGRGFAGGICIVILAIVIDRLLENAVEDPTAETQ